MTVLNVGTEDKFILGLPKGSLNRKDRGDTNWILKTAGFDVIGYDSKKEDQNRIKIRNDKNTDLIIIRPQDANEYLSEKIDCAICGLDWIYETQTENFKPELIGLLDYGQARLTFALPNKSNCNSIDDFISDQNGKPIKIYTELTRLTQDAILNSKAYQERFGNTKPKVVLGSYIFGENEEVEIIRTFGGTEGFLERRIRNENEIISDITQTGSSFRKYGLKPLTPDIFSSQVGVFINTNIPEWKKEKANDFWRNMKGVLDAKKYVNIKFNVKKENCKVIEDYLQKKNLFGDEPSITYGENYNQYDVLIPKGEEPATSSYLLKNGGSSILVMQPKKIL
jgi:ATP phosphoribosyltransferase